MSSICARAGEGVVLVVQMLLVLLVQQPAACGNFAESLDQAFD
jgi:hypothetical protein